MKADEKACPKCAEAIKKAAVVCKHCGYEFTQAEIGAQKAADAQANGAAGIGCLVIAGVILLMVTCSSLSSGKDKSDTAAPETGGASTSEASTPPSQSQVIAMFQVAAKDAMLDALKDPGSAKFEDVEAHAFPDKPDVYVFCGRVNSKNGFGGYTGFQRFVAGPGIAATEDMMSDFPVLWAKACSGVGTSVWF